VVLHPITFSTKKEYNLHRILRAIDNNTILSKLAQDDICRKSEYFKPENELIKSFEYHPEIIENTKKILRRCSFEFTYKELGSTENKNKKFFTASQEEDIKLLTDLAFSGLEKRYGKDDEIAKRRVEKELKVIAQLNFSAYFLITWDIVRYSNEMGFMHVGRGSGANSIVS